MRIKPGEVSIFWDTKGKILIISVKKKLEFTITEKINKHMLRGGSVNIEFNLEGTFFIIKPTYQERRDKSA